MPNVISQISSIVPCLTFVLFFADPLSERTRLRDWPRADVPFLLSVAQSQRLGRLFRGDPHRPFRLAHLGHVRGSLRFHRTILG